MTFNIYDRNQLKEILNNSWSDKDGYILSLFDNKRSVWLEVKCIYSLKEIRNEIKEELDNGAEYLGIEIIKSFGDEFYDIYK
jgi:hypothetical protein